MLKPIGNSVKVQTILKRMLLTVIFVGVFLTFSTVCFAANPFVTSIYTADPSARVMPDGRLYVYPSHDIAPPQGCDLMDQYHVFSTNDMVNWVDHGEILRASQVPWGRPEGGFMWAPDCVYKNGKYYFYFPHPSGTDWGSTWKIGVATSTSPAGGFTVQGYIPGLESLIDPNVFIDDDGQAYFYYGGGGVCKGGKLNADMMSINGSMQTMTGLQDFHEATWVFKRNGIYYLTYSDNYTQSSGGDNRMRYATSSNPLGPWTYRGIYMDPTDSYTNHGSVVEYKGQWYAFYHNSKLSNHDWLRSICVDKLYFNADGTIQKVVQTATGPGDPTPPPASPTFYQDINYGGTARTLAAGNYTTAQLAAAGIPDNWVSSIKVPAGYTVEIYDNDNFGGTKWTFTADNPDFVVAGLNDRMSSVKIIAGGGTRYEAENGTLANGATVANDSAASGGKCIQNLHIVNSSCQINNINGGTGGSKTLRITYASNEASTITIYVNGTSAGTLNGMATGGWSTFTGNIQKTITLNSGTSNNIRIVGGAGGINLDYITIQ